MSKVHDWTQKDGICNSSDEFETLVDEVEELIRDSAHALINDGTRSVARLIMAQLAHVHRLVPMKKESP